MSFFLFLNISTGYKGDDCETDIDECALNPCKNGGTCTDGVNKYTCQCPETWTGTNCDVDVDECENKTENVCNVNGVNSTNNCTNKDGGYDCVCKEPWGGDG